ncbi:4-hydroxybenzoate polyprenyl transferase [gamma proteobacterium HTCC5015]|nr:4-hydroxybenzoate polyprenyl transferase [gamma proteobacterium HTCC5015]
MSIQQSLNQWFNATPQRQRLADRALQYSYLTRLHRRIGIYLVMWPTLWALWIAAEGIPPWDILCIFVAGCVLMRSAGCAINDYADRDFDPHVWRTEDRPLANGKVSPKEALAVFATLCGIAFVLVLFTNPLTIYLSFAAAALAAAYPFAKRHTYLPQVVLGAAFSMAIPMGFAAVLNEVPVMAWLLFTANVVWTVAYDTMYAMADREDDLKIGVKSTAILFGEADVLITMSLCGLFLLALYFVGQRFGLSNWFYLGIVVSGVMFTWQYTLIATRDKHLCLKAFLSNHWIGMTIFAGIAAHYALG